jgi:hypothetical protein
LEGNFIEIAFSWLDAQTMNEAIGFTHVNKRPRKNILQHHFDVFKYLSGRGMESDVFASFCCDKRWMSNTIIF